jgi:DNA-directed RNA polymerase sigma subunit (sigma70/sigma32)
MLKTTEVEKIRKRIKCNSSVSDALREKFGRAELKINLGYQMISEVEIELKQKNLWALPVRHGAKVKKKLTRNEQIKKLRKETDLTLEKIGNKFNISAERVRQILNDK